ncbi:hypothetical protein L2E82_18455 [Cichorium intybus]|uniref:Uncharacterized protein n=1 Tax=Cichorium intybus TaxID=13427 RepID=A0ACB9F9N6_CICIN|nr:hypothetical protein L2E82_18455 [Cichorium intybus]
MAILLMSGWTCMTILKKWEGILFVAHTQINLTNIADCGLTKKLKIYWLTIWVLKQQDVYNSTPRNSIRILLLKVLER